MGTNKNATIRYQALNKCFRNTYKRFTIKDLLEAANEALYEYNGQHDGVKKRQLYDDITYMQSEQGYGVEITKIKDGRNVFYRYEDPNYSINNQPLNESETSQLKEALLTMSRFKGMPQFEWVDEMMTRLKSSFQLEEQEETVIDFEENFDLEGREFITDLYQYIINKQVLKLTYQGFRQEHPVQFDFHPYYLKQYNNRWFVLGRNDEVQKLANIALDRIIEMQISNVEFIPNQLNFEEHFEQVIGVSVPENGVEEKVIIRVDANAYNYIKTKPLHATQRVVQKTEEYTVISIEIIPNYELESVLFQHGEQIEILEPVSLREKMTERVSKLQAKYQKKSN